MSYVIFCFSHVIPTLRTNFAGVKLDEDGWKASFYATKFTVPDLQ
jgi:hypothetical protein